MTTDLVDVLMAKKNLYMAKKLVMTMTHPETLEMANDIEALIQRLEQIEREREQNKLA